MNDRPMQTVVCTSAFTRPAERVYGRVLHRSAGRNPNTATPADAKQRQPAALVVISRVSISSSSFSSLSYNIFVWTTGPDCRNVL
ncbi:uncharacterized protein SPSK_04736 [Sporothrix schenckii 1099-18]|uniref:Uncharacterized protein n=1 Tax=Sporothrix schenckii 1099-18 TaxID=1397361 RepID=A0A0F2M5D9_SPOSC|nr:uncharacterized protein SPSK_04736 [Sporothrix schenckii 1099-18]KJR83406.1 hypothetical protein SPSK_04736 [Sporothrix schenckii 1099-18]